MWVKVISTSQTCAPIRGNRRGHRATPAERIYRYSGIISSERLRSRGHTVALDSSTVCSSSAGRVEDMRELQSKLAQPRQRDGAAIPYPPLRKQPDMIKRVSTRVSGAPPKHRRRVTHSMTNGVVGRIGGSWATLPAKNRTPDLRTAFSMLLWCRCATMMTWKPSRQKTKTNRTH